MAKKKKKAPPKKRKPKSPPKGSFGETDAGVVPEVSRTPSDKGCVGRTKTSISIPDIGNEDPEFVRGNFKYLRFSAGMYYTTDLQGVTVAAMSRHPVYGCVPRPTLELWCQEDKWVDRRKQVQERWRKKIEDAVADELAKSRIEQLKGLENVYAKALQKLEENLVDAKSWEGVASALVKVAQLMDDWREKIGGTMVSLAPGENSGASALTNRIAPRLSESEARDLAVMVMRKRREQTRKEKDTIKAGDDESSLDA